ncbi:MAG: glycosyltransferase family 39 protein [Bacteroidota bacterium]
MHSPRTISILLAGLGAAFFMPFLGGVHLFDWDEINFAECTREMMLMGDYLRIYVDFEPFWEKPPFFFWLQAIAMHLFGVGEYAARFPNAVCGVITLVLLFNLGRKLYDTRFGLLWAGAFFGSILPHLYFKSGIIDPFFNLFIFLGLYHLIFFIWKKDDYANIKLSRTAAYYLFMAGFWVGMGILTKGQVAYLIVCLCLGVYWIIQRLRFFVTPLQFIGFTLAASLVTLVWYGVETATHGPWFIIEFTKYQYRLFATPDAGHKGFFGYHFVVLLLGCFPASIFAIRSMFRQQQQFEYQHDFKLWMLILFWVVLILFSIVQSKIVHYSSMCYLPLTFLATLALHRIWTGEDDLRPAMRYGLLGIGGLIALVVGIAPFAGMNLGRIIPYVKDPFAQANMQAEVNWTGLEGLAGLFLLGVIILAIRFFNQKNIRLASGTLFGGMGVFILLTLVLFIGKIETYSQRAAIEFFESLQGQETYVTTKGYKSYAHLFYARKQPILNPNRKPDKPPTLSELLGGLEDFKSPVKYSTSISQERLFGGEIDRPVHVATKVNKAYKLEKYPKLELLYEKIGFVFFRRFPEP